MCVCGLLPVNKPNNDECRNAEYYAITVEYYTFCIYSKSSTMMLDVNDTENSGWNLFDISEAICSYVLPKPVLQSLNYGQ